MGHENENENENLEEKTVQRKTWQDGGGNNGNSGNNNTGSDPVATDPNADGINVVQKKDAKTSGLNSNKQEGINTFPNNPEMQKGLQNMLPRNNDSANSTINKQPSNLSSVIQQWQKEENGNKKDPTQMQVIQKQDAADTVDEGVNTVENTVSDSEQAIEGGQQAIEDGQETVEGAVEDGQQAIEDGQETVEGAVDAAETFQVQGELDKKKIKEEFRPPPTILLPPLPITMQPYFKYEVSYVANGGLDVAETSANMSVSSKASFEGGLDFALNALFAKAGLNANINAKLPAAEDATNEATVEWSKDGGFNTNAKIKGAINAGINGYFQLLFYKHELQLMNVHIADIELEIGDGKLNKADIKFVWQPSEGDLIDTSKFFTWLTEDDEAVAKVAALTNEEINQLPSSFKAELLAKIRDVFVGQKHEDQILRLMGIVKGKSSKISDIAWEVMDAAYANDHNGEKPNGYEQMYEWIHTKMDGENEKAMDEAIKQEKIVDIFLGAKINGVKNKLVDINVNSFEVKGVGKELSPEDEQYFKDLVKSKDYNKLLRGSDDHGNNFRASVNIKFDEGTFIMRNANISSTVEGHDSTSIMVGLEMGSASI
ncbi:MAG: hypothetical protein MK207_12910 [Saprospiraceae bacterium]|nr:hypothetical protein [Saprospiraceae bacterium]